LIHRHRTVQQIGVPECPDSLIALIANRLGDTSNPTKSCIVKALIDVVGSLCKCKEVEIPEKRIYYLSIEYLLGRTLTSNLFNLSLLKIVEDALQKLGIESDKFRSLEKDPGLGNGGLGRLAACFMESSATCNLPVIGYGIRYDYGMFRQQIIDHHQVEVPDDWTKDSLGFIEFKNHHITYTVKLYGEVSDCPQSSRRKWTSVNSLLAEAHDVPIIGYKSSYHTFIRLWRPVPIQRFDFERFNKGDFFGGFNQQFFAKEISAVLYPVDNMPQGKELRLKQQYFFSSASVQDILRRAWIDGDCSWKKLWDSNIAIQLNDTHPCLAVLEFIRILLDKEGFDM